MDPAKGGLSQGLRNTIPELQKLDIYNEVLSLDDPNSSFLNKDIFTIHALAAKGPWVYSNQLIPWLLENFKRFDRIIVHGLWLYPSYATTKAFNIYKKQEQLNKSQTRKSLKLFVMPHGMLDPYFQEAKGRKLKAIRNWIYWKLIEGKVVNKADGILFTCKTELELARQPFKPYKPQQEINVGLGIEPPPAYSKHMGVAFHEKCSSIKNEPFILFLSRIHPKKGVDLLINAYGELLNKTKSELPKLVIAGPGLETNYGKTMQDLVKSSPLLSSNIFFTGMLSGDSKWGAFYDCEAFILPSHQENFGIAVAEALACGKPVLISDQINIFKEIEDEKAGLVSQDTLEGTTRLMEMWLKTNDVVRERMNKNAISCFNKNFEIKGSAKRLMEAVSL